MGDIRTHLVPGPRLNPPLPHATPGAEARTVALMPPPLAVLQYLLAPYLGLVQPARLGDRTGPSALRNSSHVLVIASAPFVDNFARIVDNSLARGVGGGQDSGSNPRRRLL